jgi:hypothetical protein
MRAVFCFLLKGKQQESPFKNIESCTELRYKSVLIGPVKISGNLMQQSLLKLLKSYNKQT